MLEKILILTCIIVLTMVLIIGDSVLAGKVIFEDSFETYQSSEELDEVYVTSDVHAGISTKVNYTEGGSQSLVIHESEIYNDVSTIYALEGSITGVEVTVWVKANGPDVNERAMLRIRWSNSPAGARELLLGIWNTRNDFQFRDTLAGTGWVRTEIPKTDGWHKFTVQITEEGTTLLIDDEVVYVSSEFTAVSNVGFMDLWGNPFEEMVPVYFDDLKIMEL